MDFYARQEAARRATRWLLLAFFVSVALVVAATDAVVVAVVAAFAPKASPWGAVVVSTLVVLLTICGASLFKTLSLRSGGGVVARSLGGTRVDGTASDPALRRLHNIIEEMAIASGTVMPEVYVLEAEDAINAFAAGNSPADAVVAVTHGAVSWLSRDELQGVVAHEFSHILNGDMRLNQKLLGWTFGLMAVASMTRMALQHSRVAGHLRRGAPLVLGAFAVMALGYLGVFLGRILQAAISRSRERLADASAVQFTRNPVGLYGALLKITGISSGSRLSAPEVDEVAHMLFAPGIARFFATHPAVEERLAALDPRFHENDLPRLAAAAASQAERLRQAESARVYASPTNAPTKSLPHTPRAVSADAGRIVALTGTIGAEQVHYAEGVRTAIVGTVHLFADSSDHARALMFALLVSRNPQVMERQRTVLERAYGTEVAAQIIAQREVAEGMAPDLRLPVVQQLFPLMRRLSLAERQKLHDVTWQLALADAQIDMFECCLSILLATNLQDQMQAKEQHGKATLYQQATVVHALFCVLAAQGGQDRAQAVQSFEVGISVVLPEGWPAFREIDNWPVTLRYALKELVQLRPLAKKTLIEGMVHCIARDRKLSLAESQLLRTVCAALHCPLPPILQAGVS